MSKKQEQIEILKQMRKLMEQKLSILEEKKRPGIFKLLETDLEKAELIFAAQGVVNDLNGMAEKVAKMQAEDILPLVNEMKGVFDSDFVEQFDSSVSSSLTSILDSIKTSSEDINNHVLHMEGKLSTEDLASKNNDMAKDDGELDLGDDEGSDDIDLDLGGDDEEGDSFGGLETDNDEPLGRVRKESRNSKKKVLESKKNSELKLTDSFNKQLNKLMPLVESDEDVDLKSFFSKFKMKDVGGVYSYVHYENPNGTWIQKRKGIDYHVVYSDKDGKQHEFDNRENFLDFMQNVANQENRKKVKEGLISTIAKGVAGTVGGAVGAAAGLATPIPGGSLIGRALGAKAGKDLVDIVSGADEDTESDDEKDEVISKELEKNPNLQNKLATAIQKANPQQLKALIKGE